MKRKNAFLCLFLIGSLLAIHNPVFSMKRSRTSEPSGEACSLINLMDMVPALAELLLEGWIAENSDPATIIRRLRDSGYSPDHIRYIMTAIRNRAIIVSNRTGINVYFSVTLNGGKLSLIVPANQRRFLYLGQKLPSTRERIQVQAYSEYENAMYMEGLIMIPMPMPNIWVRGGDVIRLLPPQHYQSLQPDIQGPRQFQ